MKHSIVKLTVAKKDSFTFKMKEFIYILLYTPLKADRICLMNSLSCFLCLYLWVVRDLNS